MEKESKGEPVEGVLATPQEAISAWMALSPEDKAKLKIIAAMYYKRIAKFGDFPTENDVMQEAFFRVLDGSNSWPRNRTGFVPFMAQTLRGVARDVIKKYTKTQKHKRPVLESELDQEHFPDGLAGIERDQSAEDPESLLIQKQLWESIQESFSDDEEAWLVLEALLEGKSGPEIKAALGLTDKQFAAARKRITRRVIKLTKTN